MNNNNTLIFYGGDRRIAAASGYFVNAGFNCTSCCCDVPFDNITAVSQLPKDADFIILPIPSFVDDIYVNCKSHTPAEHLFAGLKPGAVIFGGMISDFIFRLSREYNITVYDYAACEEFSVLNAVPTAEAAIICAANKLEKTIFSTRFDIIGYGRIGKALGRRLSALGGKVKVAARSAGARSFATIDGFEAVSISEYLENTVDCDILFNTVPCRIIDTKSVADSKAQFIDLASKPGGFTQEAEDILGDRLTRALSLPGKYSPVSAGEIIYKTVNTIIKEIGG